MIIEKFIRAILEDLENEINELNNSQILALFIKIATFILTIIYVYRLYSKGFMWGENIAFILAITTMILEVVNIKILKTKWNTELGLENILIKNTIMKNVSNVYFRIGVIMLCIIIVITLKEQSVNLLALCFLTLILTIRSYRRLHIHIYYSEKLAVHKSKFSI